jgi:hypothetical protein
VILFIILLLTVYADPLFRHRNFGGRDLLAYNLPMEYVTHDAYSRGRTPIWNSEISGGRPLMPNPNSGALYPIRPLLALVSFPLAMRIFPVLHWILAGIGMLLLLRELGGSRAAAWVGSTTFTFSGVAVSEVFFPHIQPGMTLLPWILWAVVRPMTHRGGRILLLCLLLALDLLAADVFTIGLAILGAMLWIVLEVEPARQKAAAIEFSAALFLAGLLAAPQIVATALWIPETNRAVLGMKLGDALFFSISPFRLLEFVVPYPFGRTWSLDPVSVWGKSLFRGRALGIFATQYCGAFAVIAVAVTWKARRSGLRFARVLLAIGLLFSILPSLIPARWENFHSPISLRNPEKLGVLVVFALSLLAGLSFDLLRRVDYRCAWILAVSGILALGAAGSALWPEAIGRLAVRAVGSDPSLSRMAASSLSKALAEAGVWWMVTLLGVKMVRKPTSFGLVGSLILLTVVPVGANRRIARTFREDEVLAPTAFARMLQRQDPSGTYRTVGESLYYPSSPLFDLHSSVELALDFERRNWFEHTQALWKRGTVFNSDFDAGDLARVEALRRISGFAARYRDSAGFFEGFALRWGIRFRDQVPLAGYHAVGGDALQVWDENPKALADIRLVQRWREERGGIEALNAVSQLAAGEIVLETGERRRGVARPGQVQILEKSPERLVLETRSLDPTWLFVLRSYWNNRHVELDGRPVPYRPAQLAFSAVWVPAGTHRLDWREQIPGSDVSRFGPLVFLLTVIGFWRRHGKDPI